MYHAILSEDCEFGPRGGLEVLLQMQGVANDEGGQEERVNEARTNADISIQC